MTRNYALPGCNDAIDEARREAKVIQNSVISSSCYNNVITITVVNILPGVEMIVQKGSI